MRKAPTINKGQIVYVYLWVAHRVSALLFDKRRWMAQDEPN